MSRWGRWGRPAVGAVGVAQALVACLVVAALLAGCGPLAQLAPGSRAVTILYTGYARGSVDARRVCT